MSRDEEIENIFKLLRNFIENLSSAKTRAIFYSFREKLVFILFYSLNSTVLLKIRGRAFKILLNLIDIMLVLQENLKELQYIFEYSLDFLDKTRKFSINSLVNECELQKIDVYGEWVKQIQEKAPEITRKVAENKLLNVFF